ncbi:MAG: hypothetical protein N3D15_02730, partial [Syntrophorhabdaceae bacterium]|nr:hypothetical protein [Syntrophorhabdaceae bacterium]
MKNYLSRVFLCLLCLIFIGYVWADEVKKPARDRDKDKDGHINIITISGAINPPVANFISESISKSERENAEALICLIDTPGGLDTSMREIVKAIMDSKVPVIVYVYPSGARAASAGSIIPVSYTHL